MSDSPNSLVQQSMSGKRNNRIIIICVVMAMMIVSVMAYSLYNSSKKNKAAKEEKAAVTESDIRQTLTEPETFGLSLPPKEEKKEEKKLPAQDKISVTVVRPIEPTEAEKQHIKELQELRTFKLERMKAALAAPLKIQASMPEKKNVKVIQTDIGDVRSRHPITLPNMSNTAPTEGNDQKDKEAFLNSRAAKDGSWQLPYERVPGKQFELKTGSVIAGIMITGINSDLPGQIIGQVSQNIYDTATGQYMLIPQGARMIGVYDSRVAAGQTRVLVAWNRIIFPDGSSITLGIMPGTDVGGYAGYSGDVDNHYLRIFGSSAIMSLISGGMAFAMDSFNKGSSSSDNPSLQDELGSALSSQLGQSTLSLLQNNMAIKPAISTAPGKRFNMVVTKDIVFARPYKPYRI
ncbi:TrbI/VirB10 family protein [Maridesulfovibrio salexigens]|uniref:Conjugation TrbI family protein n=1 Tax=Maridesulfovibrio salexigens (strain ATCC 14822 / DSM 2638 / NCIMB 8403 / VKM B-1763) TaxID=526222 RepID=C6BT47_MARSD|nr:TrbI/VirB10 family protein [Maridesulfovibrio salexigens]ACS79751.1 conjugation TrbI family protein [Maridesulfovibrio salexigens DSM 2638]